MVDDIPRSRAARVAAERALVRVVHHYGARPEFVVLGGLVPELLCSRSEFHHAGTTDVDVQVNLEIASGAVHTVQLEQALLNAEFEPDSERAWRWVSDTAFTRTVVKFELLADIDDEAAGSTFLFKECKNLGAVNLRGTKFASRDVMVQQLTARIGGVLYSVDINVTGLAGFLLAKTAAAYSRRKPKDWYDIAFVLLHNDAGGPGAASQAVLSRFGADLSGMKNALGDLHANFATSHAQGPRAYVDQMRVDHPDISVDTLAADAILAVDEFYRGLPS